DHRHAERVGEQDEFLPTVAAQVARVGEELDGSEPLRLGELDVLHKGVQMLHERTQDLAQPRIGCGLEPPQDLGGDGVLGGAAAGHRVLHTATILIRHREATQENAVIAEKHSCPEKTHVSAHSAVVFPWRGVNSARDGGRVPPFNPDSWTRREFLRRSAIAGVAAPMWLRGVRAQPANPSADRALDIAEWSYFWVGVEQAHLARGTVVNG